MKESRVVEVVDIVNDKVADHHYKESEDLSQFTSSVTGQYLTIDYLIIGPKFVTKTKRSIHTGYIEVFMQGKCGRNTETTFDIK